MSRILQLFRRACGASLFLLLLLYVGGGISTLYSFDPSIISRIQFIPAFLAGSFGTVISITLFTLLFGRWYCSFLCPLGILQDILARFRKKKLIHIGKKAGILRYLILTLSILSLLCGASILLLLVDPWSIFGRLTTTFVLPIITFINNQLSALFLHFGLYVVAAKEYNFAGLSVVLISVSTFTLLSCLLFHFGPRFWCNTLCPVGTILCIIARKPLIRIQIDHESCVQCGSCQKQCKTGVIDLKTKQVDSGNCVTCFNCLPVCRYSAISYATMGQENSK